VQIPVPITQTVAELPPFFSQRRRSKEKSEKKMVDIGMQVHLILRALSTEQKHLRAPVAQVDRAPDS